MVRLKSPEQIDGIRKSCRILSQLLTKLKEMVRPGVSSLDLDAFAQDFIRSKGGTPSFLGYHGFPNALCTSTNEAVIHGIPSRAKLREGDVIGIDCGIILDGYYSDSAITVPVGEIATEISELLSVTHESLMLGIEQAKAGNRINDISRAIYEHVSAHGYGVVRPYCGHGLGFDIHEDPQVPNYVGRGPNPRLKPGMVLAIEPMINLGGDEVEVLDDDWTVVTIDRSVSAHFEHTVAIFSDHTEILTLPDTLPEEKR